MWSAKQPRCAASVAPKGPLTSNHQVIALDLDQPAVGQLKLQLRDTILNAVAGRHLIRNCFWRGFLRCRNVVACVAGASAEKFPLIAPVKYGGGFGLRLLGAVLGSNVVRWRRDQQKRRRGDAVKNSERVVVGGFKECECVV